MDINKRLYRILSEYFKNNIKLSFIAFRNVIIVTKEDRVYQFDEEFKENYCSVEYCRDDKELKTLIEESIIEELCGQNVVDFKSGINQNIARTSHGKVYVWGNCELGTRGNGLTHSDNYKPVMDQYFKDLNITDMSCGYFHT
jgi:alpha-tubulin suppressor-like RCC1 family protein